MAVYNLNSVAEYHERRKKYTELGFNGYENAEYIVSLLNPLHGTVLEIGTGRGLVTLFLARKSALTSLDIDEEIQEFAAKLAKSENLDRKVEFINRNLISDPLPAGSFDNVLSANAFHHFDNPVETTKNMCNIASRKIVIADFTSEGFDILDKMRKHEGEEPHGRGNIPLSDVKGVMESEGFRVTRHEKYVTIAYMGER